jgi:hypothetical protein
MQNHPCAERQLLITALYRSHHHQARVWVPAQLNAGAIAQRRIGDDNLEDLNWKIQKLFVSRFLRMLTAKGDDRFRMSIKDDRVCRLNDGLGQGVDDRSTSPQPCNENRSRRLERFNVGDVLADNGGIAIESEAARGKMLAGGNTPAGRSAMPSSALAASGKSIFKSRGAIDPANQASQSRRKRSTVHQRR